MKESFLKNKSISLALRIVRLYKYLTETKNEFVMSKQVLRSGTSIGANIAESYFAVSSADLINKLAISQKESEETKYWLELLYRSEYLTLDEFNSIYKDTIEIQKLLTTSIKKIKKNSVKL